ncbi:hypothetical protein CYLTODRAFT_182677 [Cylindrobasidium torrendii FP15055 ss-10]|uniref:Uncharacterized protein n=1 Tax=Cylindrobasidium torrendii FP15055 ss-10 TaxID=1314674 RepID=A0A0D7AWQ6_9AGAR|nr:hypothetical protein CYLTODRAFT_182677 [Cylindrobasidium torrendii FP15055 ss-10]
MAIGTKLEIQPQRPAYGAIAVDFLNSGRFCSIHRRDKDYLSNKAAMLKFVLLLDVHSAISRCRASSLSDMAYDGSMRDYSSGGPAGTQWKRDLGYLRTCLLVHNDSDSHSSLGLHTPLSNLTVGVGLLSPNHRQAHNQVHVHEVPRMQRRFAPCPRRISFYKPDELHLLIVPGSRHSKRAAVYASSRDASAKMSGATLGRTTCARG